MYKVMRFTLLANQVLKRPTHASLPPELVTAESVDVRALSTMCSITREGQRLTICETGLGLQVQQSSGVPGPLLAWPHPARQP